MNNITATLQAIVLSFKQNLIFLLGILAILWGVTLLNKLTHSRLGILGIYPRKPFGLVGVVFSPFIHGDFNHVFFNSIPLFVLANFVLMGGVHQFLLVTTAIAVISGVLTWLFGRKAFHIGASSVIMGYWSYLMIAAYQQKTFMTIILGIICVYYFGSLVLSLFPGEEKTSWEGHVFGFIAGIAVSFIFPMVF